MITYQLLLILVIIGILAILVVPRCGRGSSLSVAIVFVLGMLFACTKYGVGFLQSCGIYPTIFTQLFRF